MAISWGSWDTSGSNGMRVGIEVSWGSNAHSVSSITATVEIYTQNIQTYTGDAQTLTYGGGSISGTTNYTNTGGSNSGTTSNPDIARLRATKTYTWTYAAGSYITSPSTRTFTATVSGAFNGVTPSKSLSSTVPGREGTTPGAPTVTSAPGNNTVSISISHAAGSPFDGYSEITSYEYSEDNFSFYTISGSFPYPIAGTNGTSKTIWVRARNAYGAGPAGSATSTPRTTPGAPGVSSSPNNGSISVSYTAPASDGGNAISSYERSTDNVNWTTSTENPFTVSGSNGTSITAYVRAVNEAGAGPSASTSSTPRTTPGAPSVSSTPTNGSVSISYGAPASDGGNAISSYQYSTDNVNWTTTPSNPFSINGANGTAITIYVRAVNAAGGGTSASATSTPRTTPSAPTSFAGDNSTFGQISLSWGAPSSNGGNAVSSYVLRTGSTVLQNTSATSYIHTGLSPYTDYSYTVTASNVAGEGTQASLTVKSLGGIAKIWNGTSWVTTLPKIWNGTSWVDAQARMWDGTEWKHGI
jgi:hypothetical protein